MKYIKKFNENYQDGDLSLDELENIRRGLEAKLDNYFGDEQKYSGDRGYQDLLEELEDIEEQIEKFEINENKISFDPKEDGFYWIKVNGYGWIIGLYTGLDNLWTTCNSKTQYRTSDLIEIDTNRLIHNNN